MSRTRITKTVLIRAPRAEVFRVVADPENILRLNLASGGSLFTTNHVEKITKGPTGVGSVWHFEGSLGGIPIKWDEQVVEWEPPRRFATKQIGGPFKEILWEHNLASVKSGTRDTHTLRYETQNQTISALDRKRYRRQMSEGMDAAIAKLKTFLELKALRRRSRKTRDAVNPE